MGYVRFNGEYLIHSNRYFPDRSCKFRSHGSGTEIYGIRYVFEMRVAGHDLVIAVPCRGEDDRVSNPDNFPFFYVSCNNRDILVYRQDGAPCPDIVKTGPDSGLVLSPSNKEPDNFCKGDR